jgi:glutamine amidotransferase
MIIAVGRFNSADIVAAAVALAAGETADHDGAFTQHPHGWGALWRDPGAPGGLSALRDVRPATDSMAAALAAIDTDFLAIHLRRSMSAQTLGPRFTHPLQRPDDHWYFMHNGSQPTVHRLLGLPESRFDSAEYFDYLIPPRSAAIDAPEALEKLRLIPEPGSNSGNAFAVRPGMAYVIHWRSPSDRWPRYFTMHELSTPDARIISSEIVPALAPAAHWRPLPPQSILEIPF